MTKHRSSVAVWTATLSMGLVSCSSSDSGGAGTGGFYATGGSAGSSVGSGGTSATGGIGATGAVGASGGFGATGGVGAAGAVAPTGGVGAVGGVGPTGGVGVGGGGVGASGGAGASGGVGPTGGTNGIPDPSGPLKPRVVVLTDISTWETDDHESMIRYLVHADLFEIEALVLSTGYSYDEADETTQMGILNGIIDSYEVDLPNLLKRSEQVGHDFDDAKQPIGYWPSPQYLRSRSMMGSLRKYQAAIGEGNDSPGSEYIIQLAAENDDRPVWVTVWGGGNTMCQAVYRAQTDMSEADYHAFLEKTRIYTITDQDRHYRDGGDSCHDEMRGKTGDHFLFIWDECAWKRHNSTGKSNWGQYTSHIQGHGSLGGQYPAPKYGVEGDTPSFLYLMPTGLNDPDDPSQCSWGGTYESSGNNLWRDAGSCGSYFDRFYPAAFNNFAARMDWAADGAGNRNPVIVLNGEEGAVSVLRNTDAPGTSVTFDASATYDPDGDNLTFSWWTQSGDVNISGENTHTATVQVPAGSAHLILEVTDDGTHNLSAYRRVVFN